MENGQSDLLLDGYTAITSRLDPRDAEDYHVALLKRERILFQWHIDVTGAFWAPPPAVLASDQHLWLIDYAVRDAGPVIPQKIWTPKKASDKVRRVDHEKLHPPIFFFHDNGRDLGLPLIEAAGTNTISLQGAEEAAPVGQSAHAQIRINWCGYRHLEWNEQISIQRQTEKKEPISLETFARHVAKKVKKFMETARNTTCNDDRKFLIADQHISPRDIILIGTVQVSQGSWMPILQLNDKRWYARVM
ncbi:hypothetical protein DFH94DRAFT_217584 [Russula ochroleuca]|uniref:Uncharacterized protein n=1 Tax=Russula ochroleuca TaxID=152965 RepID=A0A9P5MPL5_9AGAM|nr:hypothetical protein DFH94DRAFT_217584 [Russula ochroleuca]